MHVLGALHDAHSYDGDVVTPVVGVLRLPQPLRGARATPAVAFAARHRPLRPSAAEVADVFCVPLWRLVRPDLVSFDRLGYRAIVPRFHGARRDIWGLSAVFTRDLLVALDLWEFDTPSDGHQLR